MQAQQDVEKKLYYYGDVIRQYKNQEDHIKELAAKKYEAMEGLLRTPSFENTSVQNGRMEDPVYCVVQKLVDVYDAQIGKAAERLQDLGFEIEELRSRIAGAGLDGNECRFVELRYVEGLKIKEIADKMCYSERQCQKIKSAMLGKLIQETTIEQS